MKTTSTLKVVTIAGLMFVLKLDAQERVDAPMILERASHAQMIDGDLGQAVFLYRQVATSATASRQNVAVALVALGSMYELQGSPEAIPTYERVISEFSDQPDSFMAANAKLASLSTSASSAKAAGGVKTGADYSLVLQKLIPSPPYDPRMHDFSPDGAKLLYVSAPSSDRKNQFPSLRFETYIRDSAGSVSRPLIEDAEDWEYINHPRWSPDGKYIFYHLSIGGEKSRKERRLMLLEVQSRNSRQLDGDFLELAGDYSDMEWMPDSNALLIQSDDGYRLIGLDGTEIKYFPGKVDHMTRIGSVSPDGRLLLFHRVTLDREDHAEMDIWTLNLENGELSEISNDPGYEGWPVWSRDGTWVYYVSGPDTVRNVYRRKPGSDEPPVQVTAYSNSSAVYPRILPIGGQLTFALMKDNHVIFTANTNALNTSTAVVRGSNPMLSPDGKFIYYIDDQPGKTGLWKISIDGENPQQLVSGKVLTSYGTKVLLSPDGTKIAYAQHLEDKTSLFVKSSSEGKATLLYSSDGVRHIIPSWSPNGEEIAFSIDGSLMVIPAKGGDAVVLATVKDWESWNLEWSPDGKSIAGFAYLDGEDNNHLMMVDRATGQITRLTPKSEDQYKEMLAWHPSGHRISYMYYNPENHNGSRVIDLETMNITNLVDMPDPNWDYIGNWGPDGRYYFKSVGRGSQGNWGLYALDESNGQYQQIRQYPDRAVSLPSWNSDGSLIAWSEMDSVRQIWMMSAYE